MGFWAKIICLFKGHDVYRFRWYNTYRLNMNRKGGKRRGKGVIIIKNRHYRDECLRCGKIIKKK